MPGFQIPKCGWRHMSFGPCPPCRLPLTMIIICGMVEADCKYAADFDSIFGPIFHPLNSPKGLSSHSAPKTISRLHQSRRTCTRFDSGLSISQFALTQIGAAYGVRSTRILNITKHQFQPQANFTPPSSSIRHRPAQSLEVGNHQRIGCSQTYRAL